jgi:hypothetical protein
LAESGARRANHYGRIENREQRRFGNEHERNGKAQHEDVELRSGAARYADGELRDQQRRDDRKRQRQRGTDEAPGDWSISERTAISPSISAIWKSAALYRRVLDHKNRHAAMNACCVHCGSIRSSINAPYQRQGGM